MHGDVRPRPRKCRLGGGRLGLWLRARLRLRLGGGVGGSVPVAMPDSLHSTCIELQLSLATTSFGLGLDLA